MTITIQCPKGKHDIPVDVLIFSTGSSSFSLPHFCPTCRVSYTAQQLAAMDDDTEYQIHEYERSWQMLDGFDDDDPPLEAA